MSLRRLRPRRSDDDRILPMINVVFLLLVFFMVAGQLSSTDLFEITPPNAEQGADMTGTEAQVLVAASGALALDGVALDEEALIAGLRIRAGDGRTAIRLKADARADAAGVARLLARFREAGIRDVRLVTAAR